MYNLAAFATLAFALSSSAAAVAVPKATPPTGWLTEILEPYDTYHARYMALSCKTQHSTPFFDACCHPLKADETLDSRPAECNPDGEDDLPFCDEIPDDEDTTTVAVPVTTSFAPATTHSVAVTTPTPAPPAVSNQATASPKPAAQPAPVATPLSTDSSPTVYKGGFATFYYQNNNAGACGNYHKDGDLIAAIDGDRYGDLSKVSSQCGKKVLITNTNNNKQVTVLIADACPTCTNSNSIDLSTGAFNQIATPAEGMVPIQWQYV